jgi:hypothetical protein
MGLTFVSWSFTISSHMFEEVVMISFGDAHITESAGQLEIAFGRVGYDERFRILLDEFKSHFPFRRWEGRGWVIPVGYRQALIEFCRQRGLVVFYKRL